MDMTADHLVLKRTIMQLPAYVWYNSFDISLPNGHKYVAQWQELQEFQCSA
jgi:hypothetical protein